MACTQTISGLAPDCLNSKGGVSEVYLANYEDVTDITVTDGMIKGITMASGKKFKRYYFRPSTSSMTSTLNVDLAAGVNFVQTLLVMLFSRMETTKRIEMSALAVNDLRAIVKDANGVYWLLGEEEPMVANAGDGQTGTAKTDANRYSITLEDNNTTFPKEIFIGSGGVDIDAITE
jgi:hypothetical protein